MATSKKPVKRTSVTKSKPSSFKKSGFSKNQLIAFVLVFAAIGGILLYRSFAAAPVVTYIEGENMNISAGPAGAGPPVISDSTASGKLAMRLASNNLSVSAPIAIPSEVRSLSIFVRGSSCSGGWPWASVTVDGSTTVPSTKITSATWKEYNFPATIHGGTHNITLTSTNNGVVSSTCSRHLDVDAITFYGAETSTTTTGGTVGVPYTCTGRVNNLKVVGTGHDELYGLVKLNSGCTGSLSINITVDQQGYSDGIKVNAGAHDLNIGASSVTCMASPRDPTTGYPTNLSHQDGVQVQGGTNVTFHNLTVNCPNRGSGAFYIDGKDFSGISNVVCDGCNLSHYIYSANYTGPAPGSGVRNSTIHRSTYTGVPFNGDTIAPVHSNNTYVP